MAVDWLGLKTAALFTFGGAIVGTTLVQLAAGTVRPRDVGARFTTALGAILGGFGFLAESPSLSRWLIGAGCLCIIASSMQVVRHRRQLPKREPTELH